MQVGLDVLLFYLCTLTLCFVISSLIAGTFKSVCKTLLGIIYSGAFTVARRALF
jgi:hypothetical protein